VYGTDADSVLPASSAATTVNDDAPMDDVANALSFGTAPSQVATPDRSSTQENDALTCCFSR
jgi:hypothetical protein